MIGIVISILLVVALWFLQGQRSEIRREGKRLPRPPGTLPLAGNGIWFLQPRHKLLDWFAEVHPKVGFGTFEISVPSLPPAIVVNDPRSVEHILKNNELFIKGDFFRSRSWDLFGNGIINADGTLWKTQRKAGLRFFSTANLKSFIDEDLPPVIEDTKRFLDQASKEERVTDLQDVLLELTTRLMGKVAYDMDIDGSMPFSKSFDFASGQITARFTNPFWKAKELFFGAKMRKAVTEVKSFGRKIVAGAVAKRKGEIPETGDELLKNNLINALLDHIDDHQVVADAAMNFLSAGRDTTAQSLTWTFYSLMRHSSLIPNIRQELFTILLPKTKTSSLRLSYETIQPTSLPYTTSIFNETIRLYPAVPFELKENILPTTFPDGTYLPAGCVVLWVPWAMGRSTLIWGPDATSYKPSRWILPDGTLLNKTAYEFPVFNAGPRTCLGKKMAECLAVYVIASLVWEYDFEEVRDPKLGGCGWGEGMERKSQDSLTLPMEGGLPCRVKRVRVGHGRRGGK
ncbi:MAG: hypothetical protein MMC33_002654 [Icmadophila ericetorum]|nr:hypothetical protein [Icmadophila ericetorum]